MRSIVRRTDRRHQPNDSELRLRVLSQTAGLQDRTALITGAGQRLGAAIAQTLHAAGMNICIHYRNSAEPARRLCETLRRQRADSAELLQADLLDNTTIEPLMASAQSRWGRLDALVNNASSFFPTPLATTTERQWEDLIGTNLKAPFFLARAAAPVLAANGGCIVNIVDIHADRPLAGHPVYCAAKAGLVMLTKSLAWELGPEVRVNAVAPGAVLRPAQGLTPAQRSIITQRTALRRFGTPEDVAEAVHYLVAAGAYVTGEILTVDGGRSVQD